MSFRHVSANKMPVDKMYANKMSVDKMSADNSLLMKCL